MARWCLTLGVLSCVGFTVDASATSPVRVSLGAKCLRLSLGAPGRRGSRETLSFRGAVRVTATGPRRIDARATGGRGSYRARLVFPTAGRWTLSARAGGSTSRLGSIQVRPKPPAPVDFTEPTSIDLEPAGTLLLVENNPGRVLRVDPASGRVTVLVPTILNPYAIVHTVGRQSFLSADNTLRRLDATGTLRLSRPSTPTSGRWPSRRTATSTTRPGRRSFVSPEARAAGAGRRDRCGGRCRRRRPRGERAVLVAARPGIRGRRRVARVRHRQRSDPAHRPDDRGDHGIRPGRQPAGIDVAADGTIDVVDSTQRRLLRLSATGASSGISARPSAARTTSRCRTTASPTSSKRVRQAGFAASRPTAG